MKKKLQPLCPRYATFLELLEHHQKLFPSIHYSHNQCATYDPEELNLSNLNSTKSSNDSFFTIIFFTLVLLNYLVTCNSFKAVIFLSALIIASTLVTNASMTALLQAPSEGIGTAPAIPCLRSLWTYGHGARKSSGPKSLNLSNILTCIKIPN